MLKKIISFRIQDDVINVFSKNVDYIGVLVFDMFFVIFMYLFTLGLFIYLFHRSFYILVYRDIRWFIKQTTLEIFYVSNRIGCIDSFIQYKIRILTWSFNFWFSNIFIYKPIDLNCCFKLFYVYSQVINLEEFDYFSFIIHQFPFMCENISDRVYKLRKHTIFRINICVHFVILL